MFRPRRPSSGASSQSGPCFNRFPRCLGTLPTPLLLIYPLPLSYLPSRTLFYLRFPPVPSSPLFRSRFSLSSYSTLPLLRLPRSHRRSPPPSLFSSPTFLSNRSLPLSPVPPHSFHLSLSASQSPFYAPSSLSLPSFSSPNTTLLRPASSSPSLRLSPHSPLFSSFPSLPPSVPSL